MKVKILAGLVLLLVVGGAGAWWFWSPRVDPQMAKVQELQEQAFKRDDAVTPEERREKFQQLRAEAEKLTPEQMGEMLRKNPPPFMRETQKVVNDFNALPEDKRKAFLDKQIDQMEARRKEMRKMFAGGGGGPPGGGGPGRGPGMDPQRRQEMEKVMLNNTTAQDRAAFSSFMRAMSQRRQERGMSQMPGPF